MNIKRMWSLYVVSAAVILVAALCVPASGSDTTAYASTSSSGKPSGSGICVTGQVIDAAHQGLAGMQVVAEAGEQPGIKIETNDEGYFTFENLTPGIWTFRLIMPDSWKAITPSEFKVEVSYGHTGCYQVRFKNRPSDLCAEGYKVDENGTGLLDWTVVAYPASDPAARMQATTDSEGYYRFNGLTLGDWVFEVMHQAGWKPLDTDFVKVPITAGEHCVQVPVLRNQSPRGCIEGYKRDDQQVGLPGWNIAIQPVAGGGYNDAMTDGTGYFRFDDLPVGKYEVWEDPQVGWVPLMPTKYTVEVVPNDEYVCERVEFVNQRVPPDICIDGYKLDKNGDVGLPGFLVIAKEVASGEARKAMTDGLGYFRFGGLEPGEYGVSVMEQDGWVPVGPATQTATVESPPQVTCTTVKFYDVQEGMEPPPPDDHPVPPPDKDARCMAYHVVTPRDTLADISYYYGVSMRSIMAANHIRNANIIIDGHKLCIPDP